MGFFKKLIKGVGKGLKAIVAPVTKIVSSLNIPLVSGAAGIANKLVTSIGVSNNTQAKAATAASAKSSAKVTDILKPVVDSQKSWIERNVIAVLGGVVALFAILLFAFTSKKRR